ncbi:YtpI family protein [Lentibacillus saliphilus]|uniref:YtpI family protein n=1 Tax=Lentibacillus saliphilus TaxID=2737028 RepID=UPI001C301C15|nr:YtpI family protein [Lentibacillus saliphilus]
MDVIFPIIIILSIVLYVYYKVAILRTKDRLTQAYFNSKSRICLGSFVLFFGVNSYWLFQDKVTLFISIVFVILGGMQLIRGLKETKHYRNEWKKLNTEH